MTGTEAGIARKKKQDRDREHERGCNDAQISYYYWLIRPEEYDKAAKCCPSSCPLVAMGDLRTGQQVRVVYVCVVLEGKPGKNIFGG